MKEVAPPIVKRLAELESTKQPWTLAAHPNERFLERLIAYAKLKGIEIDDVEIRELQRKYGDNLWKALESLDGHRKPQ